MKFNKLLKSGITAEDNPASLYLRFGELKKQLKVMAHAMNHEAEGATRLKLQSKLLCRRTLCMTI